MIFYLYRYLAWVDFEKREEKNIKVARQNYASVLFYFYCRHSIPDIYVRHIAFAEKNVFTTSSSLIWLHFYISTHFSPNISLSSTLHVITYCLSKAVVNIYLCQLERDILKSTYVHTYSDENRSFQPIFSQDQGSMGCYMALAEKLTNAIVNKYCFLESICNDSPITVLKSCSGWVTYVKLSANKSTYRNFG